MIGATEPANDMNKNPPLQRIGRQAARLALLYGLLLASPGATAETEVIMLGTGTPVLDYERAGAGVAVVHDGRAYLFDIGGGVVQRVIEAYQRLGIEALNPTRIEHLFITHLHSDHVLDFAEFAGTLWWRRATQIEAFGPAGTAAMARGEIAMMAADIAIRNGGTQPVTNPQGYEVIAHDIEPGIVLDANGVRIEAFAVAHGGIEPAFGYRVTTADRTIVISGDTAYSETLIEMARGADLLIHEVISEEGLAALEPFWQNYHSSAHTTTSELARVANAARPELLVLYHVLYYGAPIGSALDEVQAKYDGEVVLAADLDRF
jgi:ribonuclease BN (tRNA processing enzyme)